MLTQSLSSQRLLASQNKPFVSRKAVNVSSRGKLVVVASSTRNSSSNSSCGEISRRDLAVSLAGSLGAAQLLSVLPAAAEGESAAQQYIDPKDAFKLVLPTNWQSTEVCLVLALHLVSSCNAHQHRYLAGIWLKDIASAHGDVRGSWHAHLVPAAYQLGC